MKKILKVYLLLTICFLFCGCDKKDEANSICTLINNQKDNNQSTTYKIYTEEDIVNKVDFETIITSEKKDTLDILKDNYISRYDRLNKSYGGYEYKLNIKNNKLIINVTIDYTKYDMEKFVNDNETIKAYINENQKFTLEGANAYYESLGAKCETQAK